MFQFNKKRQNYNTKSTKITFYGLLSLLAEKTGFTPKRSGNNYVGICPAHDDKHPSLSIKQADNGTILLCCFTGCAFEDICAALGINPSELFPAKTKE